MSLLFEFTWAPVCWKWKTLDLKAYIFVQSTYCPLYWFGPCPLSRVGSSQTEKSENLLVLCFPQRWPLRPSRRFGNYCSSQLSHWRENYPCLGNAPPMYFCDTYSVLLITQVMQPHSNYELDQLVQQLFSFFLHLFKWLCQPTTTLTT